MKITNISKECIPSIFRVHTEDIPEENAADFG
jgi:hypothetical protein